MKTIKVILIDDHAIMRAGLASLLSTCNDIEVVGSFSDGASAVRRCQTLDPDVVITDLMMPGMDGVETTRQILGRNPAAKVLILTTFGTAAGIAQALDAGATGAIIKTIDFPELAEAIRSVARGERAISPEIEQVLSDDHPVATLSPRQTEILQSITQGLTDKSIAHQIGISVPMVKEHLNAIFAKLNASNRTEAVAIALRKHLLKM